MPIVDVAAWDLERLVGRSLGEEELLEYLPKLKCEVEEIAEGLVVYEATHDRPDLFSAEGLGRALKGLLGIEVGLREFSIERERLSLDARGPEYRPYVAGAVVEGLSLDDEAVRQLMNLQEKLHTTYCRNRRKVSIGLYDLDKIEPPIKYVAVEPHSVRFTPLGETREMDLAEVLKETEKGREFGHLLAGHGKYPLLVDSEGIVLSLPPIINSEDTKVTPETKRVFIDATGVDLDAVVEILGVVATSAAERGSGAKIGLVRVDYGRESIETPELAPRPMVLETKYVEDLVGLELSTDDVARLLEMMRHGVKAQRGARLEVLVAPYRLDVLHPVDLVEDVAMAYGYENIEAAALPPTSRGRISPIERLSRKVRDVMIGLGAQEVANYMMSNPDLLLKKMRIEGERVIEVANPKMEKYTALRNWLLPGLLEILAENRHLGYPLRVFEVGDVAIVDEECETRARTERHLGVVLASPDTTMTDILVLAKAFFSSLGLEYEVAEASHPSFIEGRCGVVLLRESKAGILGEVHPEILESFDLRVPVAAMEVKLEEVLEAIRAKSAQ